MIALRKEKLDGEPLLQIVMQGGRRLQPPESLKEMQTRFRDEIDRVDDRVKRITDPREYPVDISPALEDLQQRVTQVLIEKELGES